MFSLNFILFSALGDYGWNSSILDLLVGKVVQDGIKIR